MCVQTFQTVVDQKVKPTGDKNRRSLEASHESSTNRSQSALNSCVTAITGRILQADLLFRNKKSVLKLAKVKFDLGVTG